MDKIEEKERQDLVIEAKPVKGQLKARKPKALHSDALPSPMARRVEPRIDAELRKKVASEVNRRAGNKEKGTKVKKSYNLLNFFTE